MPISGSPTRLVHTKEIYVGDEFGFPIEASIIFSCSAQEGE